MDGIYNYFNTHQFYSILVIIMIVWLGIFLYLKNLGSKINKLQRDNN